MLKKFSLGVLSLSMSLLFTACSQDSASNQSNQNSSANKTEEVVELTFANWATAEKATEEKIKKVIAAFEAENPNIKIKNTTIPFSEIQNQLTVMTTAGNAPDVAQIDGGMGISLAAMGVMEPVDNLLSKDFLSDVNRAFYNVGAYEDKHYLIPWTGGTNGFWYNKKIMKEAGLDPNKPPKTMQELEAAMEQVKKLPDVVPLQFDITPRAFSTTFQWPFILALGEEPFNRENVQIMGMKSYAEWLRSLVSKGYTLPGKKLGEFRPLAAQNRLAFGFDAPLFKGTTQSFDNKITDEVFFDTWGVTTLPVGADGLAYTLGGSDHFTGIFKASKHKEEAAKFLEFLVNSDVGIKEYVIPMGSIPVTASAIERFPNLKENPITKAFIEEIIPTTIVPPYGSDYSNAASILATNMQDIISSSKSIDEILNVTQTKLEGVVKGK